jgi:hypothetical protein
LSRNPLTPLVRYRMAETGEKYTTALRAVQADPAERKRLQDIRRKLYRRRHYPFSDKEGLDRRHVLSAWETQRRAH